jgi:Glycosyltransferase like family 2
MEVLDDSSGLNADLVEARNGIPLALPLAYPDLHGARSGHGRIAGDRVVASATVIIPLHRRTAAFERCVGVAVAVAGSEHAVLVVSDRNPGPLPDGAELVLTGSKTDTSPAEKRDVALERVATDVCAFLDDDAYPAGDWLERGLARLAADASIAAVGGPGVTPPGSPWRERVAGAFYESPFGSGGLSFRFRPVGPVRDVDDLPAYNLLVRTDVLRSIDGWNSKLYGGEDTMTCLALLEAGHRIVYDPDVVVYHYRRPILMPLVRQVGNVGRHRGHFARVLPATSRRPLYFAPTAGVAAASGLGLLALRSRRVRALGLLGGTAAWAAIARRALEDGCEPATAAVLPGVVAATHAAYGVQFARGFVTSSIEEM